VGPRHPMLNWGLHQGPTYELLLLASVSGELASVSGKHYINYSLRFRASLLRFRASITTTLTTRFGFGRAILASVSGKQQISTCFGFGQAIKRVSAERIAGLRFIRLGGVSARDAQYTRPGLHPIYICVGPRHTIVGLFHRVRYVFVVTTLSTQCSLPTRPRAATAGSGYTRARTPQGGA
jgi:hypothetical protein